MNKHRKTKQQSEGYVLSVVLVIMVTFSFTCLSLMNYAQVNGVETSEKSNTSDVERRFGKTWTRWNEPSTRPGNSRLWTNSKLRR